MPPRRQNFGVLMIIAVSAFLGLTFVLTFRNQAEGTRHPDYVPSYQEPIGAVDPSLLHGAASAPKLENATLKYVSILSKHLQQANSPQSRTRQRSLESPAHDDGEIPRRSHRRRFRSSQIIHPPLRPFIPLWRLCAAFPADIEEIPAAGCD